MKTINTYLIEKLRIDRNTEVDDNDAKVYEFFFRNMMKDMLWSNSEYEIFAENDKVTIKFTIDITSKDFSDTVEGIINRLNDRRMSGFMEVTYNPSQRKIYIKINKNEKN